MLYKKLENSKDTDWTDQLGYVLLVYNHKLVHSTTGFTPRDAKKDKHHLQVKINLELRGKHKRKYPNLIKGVKVMIFKKKKLFDKERKRVWGNETYELEGVKEYNKQKLYQVNNWQ